MDTSTLKLLGLIWGSIIVGAIIFFIVQSKKLKLKESGQYEAARHRKIHKKYIFYFNNVLTRNRFRRIAMRYSSLSCYDVNQIRENSIKLFEKAVLVSIAFPAIALFAFQNVMLAGLTALLGIIYYDMAIDSAIDKIYCEIIDEISMSTQSIHDNYTLTLSIPKAILECDKGKYLDKTLTKIYEILTDIDGEELLYQFKRTTPVRMLGTLASICYIANNEGDVRRNKNEESAFESEMTALRREADTEQRRLMKTRIAFSSLSGIALLGLIVSPIADWYLLNNIPGTALYLKGMYGAIEKTLIIGITVLSYYLISVLRRPGVVNQVDRAEWIDDLSRRKPVAKFVRTIIPKKYKTKAKLAALLQDSISSKSFEYIYTAKIVYSILAMIASVVVISGFIITARITLWNNYGSLSFTPATYEMTETRLKQIKALDDKYMNNPYKMNEDEALSLVETMVSGLNDLEYLSEVSRLSTKWDTYYNLTFKWYYIIVAYLVGVVAWFAPEAGLLLRKKLVTFEATEDVMQLQTLMIALSNTKMDVFKALYWLAQESTVHKAPLRYAYLEYPSDPDMALQRLKDSVQSKDLKRMVAKLEKAVYSLSLGDAFSDIKIDKEQSLIMSEMLQNETIESKKQYAKLVSGLPMSIAIMGGFVGPILILGVVQLLSSFATMNG